MAHASPEAQEIRLAAQVVAKTSRGNPTDAVLRKVLRAEKGLSDLSGRAVARLVFGYFRWLAWLDCSQPVENQLRNAQQLADRFAEDPATFSNDELARAVPDWIWEHMNVRPDWLRALQAEPQLWLRAKRGHGRELAESLGECWISDDPALADAVHYFGSEDLFVSEEFQTGLFEVQDIASQIVGLLCDPKPGETWWDACAGEGGKTLHLSDLMANKGLIWASDRAEWRLKKLKLRAGRAKCFNYRARLWDGGSKLPTKTMFDGVLVDAPCSGVGTWGRNPHARWTTSEKDVTELAEKQLTLLDHATRAVKPGGKLIYSVCTLTRAETVGIVESFNARQRRFEPVELKWEGQVGETLELWPQETGGNGMFVAAWRCRGNGPLTGGPPTS